MYTHCPSCNTHFEITQEYLDIAHGQVRCGQCDHIFNATNRLYERNDSPSTISDGDIVQQSASPANSEGAVDKLSQLQAQLASNGGSPTKQKNPEPEDTSSLLQEPPYSNHDSIEKHSTRLENTHTSEQRMANSSDAKELSIKERMDQIVASLSAATKELQNTRQATSFSKDDDSPILSSLGDTEVRDTTEQIKSGTTASTISENISQTIDEPSVLSTKMAEQEIKQEPVDVEAETEIAPLGAMNYAAKDDLSTAMLGQTETPPEIPEPSLEPEVLDNESIDSELAKLETSMQADHDAVTIIENRPSPSNDEPSDSKIEQAEVIAEVEIAKVVPEESEKIEVIDEPQLDEFDIVDFSVQEEDEDDDDLLITDYTTNHVDENDIDILNELIEAEDHQADNDLFNELDDINSSLSGGKHSLDSSLDDELSSLDDEFSSLDDDFNQLDNGDDLLAELEQLENDFLSNKAASGSPIPSSSEADISDLDTNEQANNDVLLNAKTHKKKSQLAPEEVVPSFLTQTSSSSNPATVFAWSAATVLLLLLLATQYLHFNSIKFAQDASIRPILETLCSITQCALPLRSNPKKIVTVTHDVRTHPNTKNALEIYLTFKNKAPYTQTYPNLEVVFSNSLGETIARRKFMPNEYLPKEISLQQGIKNNQSQKVHLQIVDPDPDSLLSFQFNYL